MDSSPNHYTISVPLKQVLSDYCSTYKVELISRTVIEIKKPITERETFDVNVNKSRYRKKYNDLNRRCWKIKILTDKSNPYNFPQMNTLKTEQNESVCSLRADYEKRESIAIRRKIFKVTKSTPYEMRFADSLLKGQYTFL